MANKSVNFDAARFARNLTKSFSTATRQAVSYYMPFTSDTIMDIGDNVFSAREFIVENRPDRKSRNSSNILKSLSNAAFEASKSAVRDLSHGDLSFKTARAQIDDYLNRNVKSEFDFGFDDDFDAEYDENDENSGFPSEKSFSVEDFAEGIYASTSATVNAIEASYKNVALANARSSNILGDRLIANNMASMAQTMQMLETVNKNISGINVNLSYLVEYNNTTMNDFIKNTNTHFAKVEKFMDMITKKYEVENEESRRRRRNNDDDDEKYNTNVFKGLKINTKNLIGKTLEGLDNEITGGTGSLIGWSLLGMKAMFGGKLPKALEDYSYLIPDAVGGDFNPALMLLSTLVPELGKMKKLDNLFKGAAAKLKKKVTTDKMFGGWVDESSFIGRLMQYVFGDENTIASLKKQENKATSWSTQDSSILQTLPTLVNNTNVHLFEISNNVSNISDALDINVRTNMSIQKDIQSLHIDLMKYVARDNGNGEVSARIENLTRRMDNLARNRGREYSAYTAEQRSRRFDSYKNKVERGDLLYDINGARNANDVFNSGRSRMANAANSGRSEIATAVKQIITANDSIEDLNATYGAALNNLQSQLIQIQDEMHNESLMDDFDEADYLQRISDSIEELFSRSHATDSRGRRMTLTNDAKLNLERVIAEAQESRRNAISESAKNLTSDTTFMRAAVTKNPKFNIYSVYDSKEMVGDFLMDDSRSNERIQQLSTVNTVNGLLDMIAQDRFLRDQYDRRISVDAARNSNDPYIRQAYKNYQKAVQDMMKQRLKSATSGRFEQFVSGNAVNKVTGAGIDTLAKYGSRIINGDRNFTFGDIVSDFKSAYTSRQGQAKLDEEGNPITTYIYGKKDNFGKRQKIDGNYQRSAFEEDPVFTLLKAYHAANGNTYNPNTHTFYNSNGEKVKEQYSPGSTTERTYDSVYRYSQEHGIPSHATGATRIDKDKLVRVHEGEMILDSAFSDTVRKDFADMISAKAQGKTWTDDQQKHLLAAIEASDERFKGKSKEVLNAIKTEMQNHDLNGNVRLSDQSVCFIEIDQDDSPSTVMMKTLSEIATNLRTMLGASIGKATEEEKGAASTELKGNLGKLFGSFDKENKTFNGGLLSKAANAASDDVKYWLFNHIGGFSYKGRARDENGKVIEGEDVDYKNGTDNPKTISKVIDGIINKKADEIAKELGLSDQEKDMYLGSVKDILGGVKGAGKGWVAGIAIKSILGLSLGPAFGLIGGFAMANKTTRELIIGAETKDAEGNTYRYGGIFSGLVNKFTELGRDIKTSFLAVVKEVGTNLKDAAKTFITELMDKDKPSIVGNIIRGVKDMTFTLTGKITDVIVDAANIGTRLLFNTAKLPFNIAANILGGKSYRKSRKEAKLDAKDAKTRADLREFAMYQRMTGGFINERLAGIAEWDASRVGGFRKTVKKVGTSISEGYTNINDKFVGFQGKAKDKLTELLTGIKTDFGTMIREHGIGIKALMNMIPASIAAFSMGNIPLAMAIAGFNLGNVAMENLTGVGLTGLIMKGAQLLGKRVGRGIKRTAEGAGTLMHLLKNRLGIKDTKYHLKMANSSLLMDDANMLADLGFKDEQDDYYAWRKSGGSEEGLTQEQLDKYREISAALDAGLSTEDRKALSEAQSKEKRFKELSKKKKLTDDEKTELKELKSGKRDRRRQIFDLNNKASAFKIDHGMDKIGGYERAGQIAENYDKIKEAAAFKNDLFGEFKREMFITPDGNPLSDEEFAIRKAEYNKQRDLLRKQITSRFKTKDDFENNIDEIMQMISANKYVGKSKAAMEGKSAEEIRKFVLGNSYTDDAVRKAENADQSFKDAIINSKTGILGGVNQTVENLKNIADLIKRIIDRKIHGDTTSGGLDNPELLSDEEQRDIIDEKVEEIRNNSNTVNVNGVAKNIADVNNEDLLDLPVVQAKAIKSIKKQSNENTSISAITTVANAIANNTNTENAEDKSSPSAPPTLPAKSETKASSPADILDMPVSKAKQLGLLPKMDSHAEGVTNVGSDKVAQLHAGEMVLDAETASSVRMGRIGLNAGINETMASVKSSLGELVGVFKGDKHGTGDEKLSFIEKMKEGFNGVGSTVSNAVFGSGLIPIDPKTGKPDIAKIGARIIALIGGAIILGPTLIKLAEKLKPIFDPIFTGIRTVFHNGLCDMLSLSHDASGLDIFKRIGSAIWQGWNSTWESVGSDVYDDTEAGREAGNISGDKSLPEFLSNVGERTIEIAENREKYIQSSKVAPNSIYKTNPDRVASDFANVSTDENQLAQVLTRYVDSLVHALDKYCFIMNYTLLTREAVVKNFYKYLTNAEITFINKHVESTGFLGNLQQTKNISPEDYIPVFNNTTGLSIKYKSGQGYSVSNLESTPKGSVQAAIERVSKRINVLNTLSKVFGIAETNGANLKDNTYFDTSMYNSTDVTVMGNGDAIGYGYTQNDPRWSNMGYGRFRSGRASTMGAGGCGPTAMANVYNNLTGKSINPAQMARFSQANGYNAQGGTSAGLFTSGARKLGLKSSAIGKSGSAIGKSIRNGNNVLIAGKNGPYTKAGHIMSVRGVDGYGNAIVDDPLKRGARRIPMNKLTKGMTHAWSIGYGDSPMSWSNEFAGGDVNFNANGGSFGYDPNTTAGCFFNSLINGYIASVLAGGGSTFGELSKLIPPSKIKKSGIGIRDNGYVGSIPNLNTKLNTLTGNAVNIIDNLYPKSSLTEMLVGRINAGKPVVIHTENGSANRELYDIINAAVADPHLTEHAVMIPGTYTKDGKTYIVIANPARSGNAQISKTDYTIDTFRKAMNSGYVKHAVIYNNAYNAEQKKEFDQLRAAALRAKGDAATEAYAKFEEKFGCKPDEYTDYMHYINGVNSKTQYSTSSNNTTTTTGTNTDSYDSSTGTSGVNYYDDGNGGDLRTHKTTHSFGEYLAEIMSRITQFGSNMIGSFLTGNLNNIFATGQSGAVPGGGGQNYSGDVYSSGLTSTNGSLGVVAQAKTIIEDTGQIAMFLSEVRQFGTKEINEEISKKFSSKFIISESTYKDLTNSKYWAATLTALNNSTNYWKNAKALNTNKSYSHVLLYTWVMAIQTEEYAKNKTSSTVASHSGASKEDTMNTLVNNLANSYYNKINSMAFTLGTPHNDYYLIDNSFKNPAVMNEIPGGVGGGNTLSATDIAKVHQYMMDIVTTNETGASKSDPDYINKAYFTPHWLNGESNITMGRIGFYDSNAAEIFNRAMGYTSMPNSARSALDYLYKNVKSRSLSPSDVTDTMNAHPEIRPYIMSAEDAMTNEFTWDYIKRALGQYQQRGMQDPRSIILGAEFAGVAPAKVPSFYSAVTNPGAADELDQVRQGMFNTIAGFKNYSKYGKGWKNRINGMYNALTTSNGYNDHTGKYYPVPAEIAALIPGNSAGYGDAGYNMRDNNYRYTDDVYMGDADHPMNVTMDNTPVTTRLDKLIYLLDSAVNYEEPPKAGPSNAKSLGSGDGEKKPQKKVKSNAKGVTNVGQHDKLATIHSRIAKRPRVSMNYNHM